MRRLGLVVGLVLALVLAGGVAVARSGLLREVDRPGEARQVARSVFRAPDVVVVFDVDAVDADLAAAASAAARDTGASAYPSRGASIGMTRVRRGDRVIQQTSPGFRVPMIATALPPVVVAETMGRDVSGALGPSSVVMGERTARLRGAQAGDLIDVVAASGQVVTLRIGAIGADEVVGGTELLMTTELGERLGIVRDGRMVIYGFESRQAIDQALARRGLTTRRETRIVRSWDAPSPDATLGMAATKELLGEFEYRITSTGAVVQEPAWQAANLPAGREVLSPQIPIRARCHLGIVDDLRAALDEVAAAGLGGAIEVANANAYGGCHYPRFNRIGGELGYLSRHSWGMALDTNTVSNCQGCVPKMDCRVVRIFRRHGFAWGGNFLRPDGMHFEWVGERRDTVTTPVRYCPNPATDGRSGSEPGDSRALLYDDVTLAVTHDHDHGP
jgi:hypothetical protein